MRGTTNKQRNQKDVKEYELNKGIEVMLPRSRRRRKPSWFDRTFFFFRWSIRLRIDLLRKANGN